jgi:hypothetical protein
MTGPVARVASLPKHEFPAKIEATGALGLMPDEFF